MTILTPPPSSTTTSLFFCLANDEDYYNNDNNNNDQQENEAQYHDDNEDYHHQYHQQEEEQYHQEQNQHNEDDADYHRQSPHHDDNDEHWGEEQQNREYGDIVDEDHHVNNNHNEEHNYDNEYEQQQQQQQQQQDQHYSNDDHHEEEHREDPNHHYYHEEGNYHHHNDESGYNNNNNNKQEEYHHEQYNDESSNQQEQQEQYHDTATEASNNGYQYEQDQEQNNDIHHHHHHQQQQQHQQHEENNYKENPNSYNEDYYDQQQLLDDDDEYENDEYKRYQHDDDDEENLMRNDDNVPPGVDTSWPIHYYPNRLSVSISSSHSSSHNKNDLSMIERKRRIKRHLHFMEGCSMHYSRVECETSDQERMMMNLRQPRMLMNYTSAGYAKMEAPASVFTMLRRFYNQYGGGGGGPKLNQQQQQNHHVRENWPPGNIYINHWASTVKLLPINGLLLDHHHGRGGVGSSSSPEQQQQPSLSKQQRKEIISKVQPILESWCKMPLIPTSLYGIRTYKRGSILAPHVDRLPLVISAIINVAQQELIDDWPLEIIDHSGQAINITMKPGDMVLYEGATVIHGRPYPLNGQSYSNIFLHFEPVGYSERYHNGANQNKKKRKEQKDLFEEALAKQQKAQQQQTPSDRYSMPKQNQRPYYVPAKKEEQWEQRFVYVKRTPTNKRAAKKNKLAAKQEEYERDLDERLFHNLAAKGMLMKMKEMVMEDPTIITKKDHNGWLALHEAARSGHTHVVEYLCSLMSKSEINTRTNNGKGGTPTWWAMHMFNKDHPTVKALLKHGGKAIAPNS